jgi:ASC-1-like (ASCH) protein
MVLFCHMAVHKLNLSSVPFNAIAFGTKTIESRLYDEKRQQIQLGDEIIFTNNDLPTQKVTVKVIGLLRYKSFHDLFSHNNAAKFGGESVSWLNNQINEFYSKEAQNINGVIGIEFRLL